MLTGAFYAQAGTDKTCALLAVRLHCSIRGSEFRYSALCGSRVFLGAQPRTHMLRTSGS